MVQHLNQQEGKKTKQKHKPKQNTNPKEIQYSSPAQAAGTEKEIGLQARM